MALIRHPAQSKERGGGKALGPQASPACIHLQVLAEMGEDEEGAEVDAEVSSAMKPSPSALMLAAGLATAQSTLRDRGSSAGADDLHCAPSTELQAGYLSVSAMPLVACFWREATSAQCAHACCWE